MKLILANNQSAKFQDFFKDLEAKSKEPFDYTGYSSLLFMFDVDNNLPLSVYNLADKRDLSEYSGVYINGYLSTYELAATVAIACQHLNINFVNQELHDPPSLSKLSMYAKLAAAGVSVPPTIAGTKKALLGAASQLEKLKLPVVLKRADADRGIDNFKISGFSELEMILKVQPERSLWLVQSFIPNDGFYLVSFYDAKPAFSIYRTLEARPDGNQQKAHMYKPKGGANAALVELNEVPREIMNTSRAAIKAMNRQIGSVDSVLDKQTQKAYVLEVNYNPQLVTIETFKQVRQQAFLDYIEKLGETSSKN